METLAEAGADQAGQQAIAEPMAGAIGGLGGRYAGPRDHVEPAGAQGLDHGGGGGRIVGPVAVDQHIDVRLHVGEHQPDHVALALQRRGPDDGARRARDLHRAVGGVVVVDIDPRRRQGGPEGPDHLADGGLLIVAGGQNGDLDGVLGRGVGPRRPAGRFDRVHPHLATEPTPPRPRVPRVARPTNAP